MKHRMELNHSIYRDDNNVEIIKDIVLTEIGLPALEDNLDDSGLVVESARIFKALSNMIKLDKYEYEYHYDKYHGDHLFIVSNKKRTITKITEYVASLRKDNTTLVFMRADNTLILKVNKRLYPLSGSDKVIAYHCPITSVFKGGKFIISVYKQRRVEDTREIWTLSPEDIKRMINSSITVISEDLKRYWFKTAFTASEAVFLVERLMESLHALLCLVEVNNNYFDFKERPLNKDLALELLDREVSAFHSDPRDPVKVTEIFITMVGTIAVRLAEDNYQNLFKGFTKS